MKKRKILIMCMLCTALAFGLVGEASAAGGVGSVTSQSIKNKENQMNKAEKELDKLEDMLSDVKAMKKSLESKKNNLKEYIKELDANLNVILGKIAELEGLIATKEQEIEQAEADLANALAMESTQYEMLKKHIQMMYEQGDMFVYDVIITGTGISDVLTKMEYVNQFVEYDKQVWDSYIMNRELVEYCKLTLDAEKTVLDEAKAGVESEKAAMEELIAEKEAQISAYDKDIETKAAAIEEYEEYIAEQEEVIAALEKQIEEERRQLIAQSGAVLTYDGGKFVFPVAKYTRVSSEFGWRIHPTLGVNKFHNGVDLASPTGTNIYAAYDGVVVAATYSSTMGNYVMINHGSGLYTIYMHASKLYVKKDDIVLRGNTIAAVGSTGRSTGPHLHFGVRKDGTYVSPWNYISKK